mgnify:CR=1 FL=1|jgi:uncharacterized Actinobacterial protein TIGR03083
MSEDPIAALRASHERLAAIVAGLTPEQETAPAYPTEWSIAQVLSHIGSGAEIMAQAFDAALAGTPAPGRETYPAIWDRWNAKAPSDQVRDGIESDRRLVERFEALTADQRAGLRFTSFAGEVDADQFARLRLNEHAVHTWDVAVVLDPTATIGAEAVGPVVDNLALVAGFSGKADGLSGVVQVTTTDPGREFTLTFGPTVSLQPGRAEAPVAELALPAEAFIRLVYGRLDPAHTPPVTATGIALDDLRRAFPGF